MRATSVLAASVAVFSIAMFLAAPLAVAGDVKYEPNVTIGQWKIPVKEAPVRQVRAMVRRLSGSNKTFINARFGREGTTFENGRRVYLETDQEMRVIWNVGGQMPGGKELIINAYDGQVLLRFVTVEH